MNIRSGLFNVFMPVAIGLATYGVSALNDNSADYESPDGYNAEQAAAAKRQNDVSRGILVGGIAVLYMLVRRPN